MASVATAVVVWESRPVGRRVMPLVAVTFGVAAIALPTKELGELVLAAAFLLAAALAVGALKSAQHRAGAAMAPVVLALWGVGHLIEAFTRARPGWSGWIAPADIVFVLILPTTVLTSLRFHIAGMPRAERMAAVRLMLDSMLIAAGALTMWWHLLVGAIVERHRLTPVQGIMFGLFIATAALVFAPQAMGAVTRRDVRNRWLTVSTVLMFAGILIWTVDVLNGPYSSKAGLGLTAVGVLLLPTGLGHPERVEPRSDPDHAELESMAPLVVLLFGWAVSLPALLGHPLNLVSALLMGLSLALVASRLAVVRATERALIERLRSFAFTDPLTEAGNRRSIASRLELTAGWLITTDMDRFKEVNDQHGHHAGDALLMVFAQRLSGMLPPGAHLARMGGDEFAICLPNSDRQTAADLSAKVLAAGLDGRYSTVSVSVGIAPYALSDDPATALRNSDIALQSAKASGRNRVAILDEAMVRARVRELAVAQRLRSDGLDRLRVDYQPIVALDVPGRPVVAVEALARWSDPVLGDVAPDEFIPIAERSGMIGAIGLRVLQDALGRLERWHADGVRIQVTVNTSWVQLREPPLVASIVRALRSHQALLPWVVLEVTEGAFATDDGAVAAVRELRRLGVSIAIDDFGIGASSLTRLRRLPVDVLKIDRSLTIGVGIDPAADAVLESVVTLGGRLGITIVVEGIEDERTALAVQHLGLTLGQGYHFAMPGPAAAVSSQLTAGVLAMPRRRPSDAATQL
ncbi:MAG: EAL domain-containing protein [Actinomycetota bacterium]|nr:EAL domain-containing protein [Actinomycetota bacterium]